MSAGEGEVGNSSGGSFSFWGLRSKKGKQGGWGDEMDPKMDAVMGVPVPGGKVRSMLCFLGVFVLQEAGLLMVVIFEHGKVHLVLTCVGMIFLPVVSSP